MKTFNPIFDQALSNNCLHEFHALCTYPGCTCRCHFVDPPEPPVDIPDDPETLDRQIRKLIKLTKKTNKLLAEISKKIG